MTRRLFFPPFLVLTLFWALSGIAGLASELGSQLRPAIDQILLPEATVHSAPDRDAYITSLLQQGDPVEIYLEVDGWCAIRPPKGSFSWVSASYVELDKDSDKKWGKKFVGTVTVDGLASRIGSEMSELGELSGTIQVKLRKGERVLVLDSVETPENTLSPRWFKIAPPSGEYRWIHRDAFLPPPAQSIQKPRKLPKVSPSIRQVVYESEPVPVKKTTDPTNPRRVPEQPADIDQSLDEIRRAVTLPSGISGEFQAGGFPADGRRTTSPVAVAPFQKTYEELKMATLSILTRPADDGEFEILIERAKQLYKEAPTNQDLEKVFHLTETLQRARLVRQEIAMRRGFRTNPLLSPPQTQPAVVSPYTANAYAVANRTRAWNTGAPVPRTTDAAQSDATIPNRGVALGTAQYKPLALYAPPTLHEGGQVAEQKVNVAEQDAEDALTIPEEIVTFDAKGRLGAFDDIPEGYPPFALVDDNEEVVCLLTPGRGLDLEPFVGKTVGVKGRREFYRVAGEADKRHVTVLEVFHLKEP